MNKLRLTQGLLSFIGILSFILIVALCHTFLHGHEALAALQQHIEALTSLSQTLNSLEAKNLHQFLNTVQNETFLIHRDFLKFLFILTACILASASYWLFLNIRSAEESPKVASTHIFAAPKISDITTKFTEIAIKQRDEDWDKRQVFSRAIDNLKCATEALAKMVGKGSLAEIEGNLDRYEHYYNRIIQIAASGNLICNEIQGVHKSLLKTSKRLQRLAYQCRDSANFSATTQLDWKRNIMINNLRQVKESHDKVQDTANHICSIHHSSQRLLLEVLGFDAIFKERAHKVSQFLQQIQEESKPGFKDISNMVTSISESKDQVTQAASLVNGLNQRAEAIVTLVHMIDDLAEQINLQALNASIEAAKIGNHGHNFSQIAEKLCKLTSRSNVTSHSISELLSTILEETHKANTQLHSVCEVMEAAFTKVNDCGHIYRKAVSSSKYAFSELNLLENEFNIHLNKLREVEKLGKTSSTHFTQLIDLLENDSKMSNRINDETNKLTAHSDRLSQLLAKQFHELNHCEKMLLDSMHLVSELEKQATENKHISLSLKVALEDINTDEGAIPLDDNSQRIANRHLTLLKTSTETLEHLRLPDASSTHHS